MIRKTFAWLVRRGVFDNTWVVAGVLLVVVALLSILPVYLGYPGLLPPFGLLSLALASFFAWRSAAHYAGSRLAEGFIYVTVFALVLLVKESLVLAHGWGLWPYHLFRPWDAHLGNATTILLFLTSLVLLASSRSLAAR
jgi:hypothetical protein